ncbi:VanZ family protein [Galbibacter sp. BG1]|uniref:VanZ family protein n=1 Tax=Galbibacter sp. BG1 TaxID=1170699 RepID=UPI0015BD6685|nr:VanZ family protein [Galbibacter sp. BG1]QLE01459.1 VanZ family protein [Galbibacter sp. BG1]
MPIIKNLLELPKYFYLSIAVFWLCAITVASLISVDLVHEVESEIEVSDKLVHGIFYFVNTVLFYLYLRKTPLKNPLLKISLFSFVYGMLIEVLQYVMPFERSFDLKDVLANSIGILIAIFLIKFWLAYQMR